LGFAFSVPFLTVVPAIRLYSPWLVRQENGGVIPYPLAFAVTVAEYLMASLVNLIVLDVGMFFARTPRVLIIPGTGGLPGY